MNAPLSESDHWAQHKALTIVDDVLGGQIAALEGAKALSPLLQASPHLAAKDDRLLMQGVDNETDDLPIGSLQHLWHPDILRAKLRESERCEKLWGDSIRAAYERIRIEIQQRTSQE